MQPVPSRVDEVLRALGDLSPEEARACLQQATAALDQRVFASPPSLPAELPSDTAPSVPVVVDPTVENRIPDDVVLAPPAPLPEPVRVAEPVAEPAPTAPQPAPQPAADTIVGPAPTAPLPEAPPVAAAVPEPAPTAPQPAPVPVADAVVAAPPAEAQPAPEPAPTAPAPSPPAQPRRATPMPPSPAAAQDIAPRSGSARPQVEDIAPNGAQDIARAMTPSTFDAGVPSDEELAIALRPPRWRAWAILGAVGTVVLIALAVALIPHGEAPREERVAHEEAPAQPERRRAPAEVQPVAAPAPAPAPAPERRVAPAAPKPQRKQKADPFESWK